MNNHHKITPHEIYAMSRQEYFDFAEIEAGHCIKAEYRKCLEVELQALKKAKAHYTTRRLELDTEYLATLMCEIDRRIKSKSEKLEWIGAAGDKI
jgi:hypothetical protein